MSEHQVIRIDEFRVAAGDGMSPDVVAQVKEKARTVLLMIPKQDWETIDIDMSIKCTKAVIKVLEGAVALAESNLKAHIKEMKDDD